MVHALSSNSVHCPYSVVYHHIVTAGLPKSILFFAIPAYLVLSTVFYKTFKSLKPK